MSVNEEEKQIQKYWEENKVFEKSIEQKPKDNLFRFYDGPPFATGLPHYGHLVANLIKDIIPRYWTMKGFRVERVWGWDCHGLPVENMIEQELGLKNKKDVEEYGVGRFNEACEQSVLRHADEWKKMISRFGRWIDMENAYKTMDKGFMESTWWVFSELYKKNLIYEGKKPMQICPRCVTPLSNFEVSLGYQEIKDIAVTAKFKAKQKVKGKEVNFLAWTTTPWTLPGNLLLAVHKDITYSIIESQGEYHVIAKDLLSEVNEDYKEIESVKGKDLVGLEYEPVFPYFKDNENSFRVVKADFVTTDEGTGIVHIAPAFGEDDYNLGAEYNVGWVQHVEMNGKFTEEVKDFKGLEVKPKENPIKTDIEILKWLKENNKLFSKENYRHSYPHCWRCDTPLLNYATSSWFVNVTELKEKLIENNSEINWIPNHIKTGRFGKWLEGARDWSISRNRFWGSPLPVWKSEDGDVICISSVEELEKLSGKKVKDLHKPSIDKVEFEKDGKKYTRIEDVFDCWFESGSMPYGQYHYPFENKEKFEASFPAEFIAEGQDQTRGWFYSLHVLATALTVGKNPSIPVKQSTPAYKNVIVNGMILAEDGKKMSKKLKNYPDPNDILEMYGADALRYYLVISPAMHAETLNFSESGVREIYNKYINTLNNVLKFYKSFASKEQAESDVLLDKWILSRLQSTNKLVRDNLEEYKIAEASKPLLDFVSDLSQWYVRRSRDRFKEDTVDRKKASYTLRKVLVEFSKLVAPFTPFIAEKLYRYLEKGESVHLDNWPSEIAERDEVLEGNMLDLRTAVSRILVERERAGIPVRQVLQSVEISGLDLNEDYKDLVAEEVNVKEVFFKEGGELKVKLDTNITPELKREGIVRDLIRKINKERKDRGLTVKDRIELEVETSDEDVKKAVKEYKEIIQQSVQAELKENEGEGKDIKVKDILVRVKINTL